MTKVNILFTSVGRRVALLKIFKQAIEELSIDGMVLASDASENAAARYIADDHITLPRINNPDYFDILFSVCKKYQIDMVIPLIDTELPFLAMQRGRFNDVGITLLVSSDEDIKICANKKLSYNFFIDNGFDSPTVLDIATTLKSKDLKFPFFIKPTNGSSSIHAFKVNDEKELRFFSEYVPNPVLQNYVEGQEYTMDVLVDFDGKVHCVVPRLRIATRAGEVSKGITVKNDLLITATKNLVERMHGPVGCITAQAFLTSSGEIKFIEINPRFGGGFPLSHAAGANFPKWILEFYLNKRPVIRIDGWIDGVKMLRYDDAVFLQGNDIL